VQEPNCLESPPKYEDNGDYLTAFESWLRRVQ